MNNISKRYHTINWWLLIFCFYICPANLFAQIVKDAPFYIPSPGTPKGIYGVSGEYSGLIVPTPIPENRILHTMWLYPSKNNLLCYIETPPDNKRPLNFFHKNLNSYKGSAPYLPNSTPFTLHVCDMMGNVLYSVPIYQKNYCYPTLARFIGDSVVMLTATDGRNNDLSALFINFKTGKMLTTEGAKMRSTWIKEEGESILKPSDDGFEIGVCTPSPQGNHFLVSRYDHATTTSLIYLDDRLIFPENDPNPLSAAQSPEEYILKKKHIFDKKKASKRPSPESKFASFIWTEDEKYLLNWNGATEDGLSHLLILDVKKALKGHPFEEYATKTKGKKDISLLKKYEEGWVKKATYDPITQKLEVKKVKEKKKKKEDADNNN